MKVSLDRAAFLESVQLVQDVIERKNTIPIMANVLLETVPEGIQLSATDLEVGLQDFCPAEIEQEGSITLHARKLFEILRETQGNKVSIEVEANNRATLISGKSEFKIVGLPKDDFPPLPSFPDEGALSADQSMLWRMAHLTEFAVSQDESRYALNGVLMIIDGKQFRMVATDGHRLAYAFQPFECPDKDVRLIVPRKAVREILRILSSAEGEVQFNYSENQVFFKKDRVLLMSRLIEGDFPDFEQVMPKSFKNQVTVGRDDLFRAMKRVALLSDDKSRGIRFSLGQNSMVISSSSPELGEAKEELEITYDGDEILVGFNANYVLEVLNVMEDPEVVVELNDGTSAARIKAGDREDYLCVVMPLRL